MNPLITSALELYETLDLQQAEECKLFRRVDTKFLFSSSKIPELIKQLQPYFKVLEVNETLSQEYSSEYFDSKDFLFYHMHHNEVLPRMKVRKREYKSTDFKFMELKLKDNKELTIKKRNRIKKNQHPDFSGLETPFFDYDDLEYKLTVTYNRIAFVNPQSNERLSIDYDLCFFNKDKEFSIPSLGIIELKQEKLSISPVYKILQDAHLYSTPFSKYCYGCNLIYPDLKNNLFKERNDLVTKITDIDSRAINF